jgi:hypothetical protein
MAEKSPSMGEVKTPKNAVPQNPTDKNPEGTPGIATAGLVLGIIGFVMFLIPGLGLIISGIGFIISIAALIKINKKESKKGRGFAIAGLILSLVGIVAGAVVIYLIVAAFMLVNDFVSIMNMEGMTVEEAVEKCGSEGEITGIMCYRFMTDRFADEPVVKTGEYCGTAEIETVRDSCYIVHAGSFNTTEHCSKIKDSDLKNICMALGGENAALCQSISDPMIREDCLDDIQDNRFSAGQY